MAFIPEEAPIFTYVIVLTCLSLTTIFLAFRVEIVAWSKNEGRGVVESFKGQFNRLVEL